MFYNFCSVENQVTLVKIVLSYVRSSSYNFILVASKVCMRFCHDLKTYCTCALDIIYQIESCYFLCLYVLGNDALISKGSFMQTSVCVFWSASGLGVRLAL